MREAQDHNKLNDESSSSFTTTTTAEPPASNNSVCKPNWTDPVMSALSRRIDGLEIDGQTMPPPSTPASATASTTTAARSFQAATPAPATLYAGTTGAALLPPAPPPSPPLGAHRARVLGLREGEGVDEDDDDGAFERLSPGARRPGPPWDGEVRERRRTAREWVGALRESWRGKRVAWRPWVRGKRERRAMGYGGVTRRGRAAATARGRRGRDVEMAELAIVGEPVRRSGDGEVRREAGLRSWVRREDGAAEMAWEAGREEGRGDGIDD